DRWAGDRRPGRRADRPGRGWAGLASRALCPSARTRLGRCRQSAMSRLAEQIPPSRAKTVTRGRLSDGQACAALQLVYKQATREGACGTGFPAASLPRRDPMLPRSHRLGAAVRRGLLLSILSPVAFAQQAAAPEPEPGARTLDTVQVTGSRIRRAELETQVPVQVLSREDKIGRASCRERVEIRVGAARLTRRDHEA